MELYRYSLVAVVCLMAYVAWQQFSISATGRHSRMHLLFGFLASSIAIHDCLWIIRLAQASAEIAHGINMVQWFLSWCMLFFLVSFIDFYLFGKLWWLGQFAGVFCSILILATIILPRGGFYTGLPVVKSTVLPWGERFLAPNYSGQFTLLYGIVVPAMFCFLVAAFILTFKKERQSPHFWKCPTLTIALALILITLCHDVLVDFLPGLKYPVRLQHAGTVFLLLVMNYSMTNQLYRVARLHDQLRDSEDRLRLMVDNVPGVIYRLRFSPDGHSDVLSISGRIGDVLGEIPTGMSIMEHFTAGLLPPDREKCLLVSEESRIHQTPFTFEGRFLAPSGELRWLKLSALPTFYPDGTIIYAGIILDETTQWNSRQEQERLTRELQQSTEEQEAMLYVSTHDLRAPLLNIRGFSAELRTSLDTIQKHLPLQDPEMAAESSSINEAMMFIDKSAERMGHLLDGLLLVSRSRRIPLVPENLSMAPILENVFGVCQFRIRQLSAVIHTGDLPDCFADSNMLTQVWSNLLDNALKYSKPNLPPEIHISGFKDGEFCVYSIQDNGIGFPQEYAPTLFRLFQRLNPNSGIEGTGIGLTIVQRFLKRMGGTIDVTSNPNIGSTFTIRLPQVDSIIRT